MRIAFATVALSLLIPLSGRAQRDPSFVIHTLVDSLYQPTSIALDKAGNLYVCDWSARIFKVNTATGEVTTVAGTGIWGYSGDGGPAINAMLGGPGSLALDDDANIYFGDPYNRRVRKIFAATGVITTVAGIEEPNRLDIGDGGPAAVADIYLPEDLAFDPAGNLYIAARGEHRIRKVTAATGIITTIAGSSSGGFIPVPATSGTIVWQGGFAGDGGPATSALLNDPENIAFDGAGDLYISDTENFRIRRIDAQTGTISTVAGTGINGYSGDGGLAATAQMGHPAGILADGMGRIYFADVDNGRIRILVPARVRGSKAMWMYPVPRF